MTAYGSLCTEFYDLDKPRAPAKALAYYADRARDAGGRVLEPMCGSGRFLLPMRQLGLTVDGVDSSPAMLEACRTRARRLGLDVSLWLQSLASLDLPHRYAMAFIPSGSIGLVTRDEELRSALSRLHSHLEPDGSLFLEVVDHDDDADGPGEFEPRIVQCPDGSSITYTCIASRLDGGDTIRFRGHYEKRRGTRIVQVETEELVLRTHRAGRLESELSKCGFESQKAFGPSELSFLAGSGCRLVQARAGA